MARGFSAFVACARVGALAVVRALLLASAALAAGLAHGVPPAESTSTLQRMSGGPRSHPPKWVRTQAKCKGQETLAVDHDPGDLAAGDDRAGTVADDVPRGHREAVQAPVGVRRGRGHLELPAHDRAGREVLDRDHAVPRRRRRPAAWGPGPRRWPPRPGEQRRGRQDRQGAGAERGGGVVVGHGEGERRLEDRGGAHSVRRKATGASTPAPAASRAREPATKPKRS